MRKRLVVTFLLILVYRVGCYVVLPGIDPNQLAAMKSFTSGGLMQLLDMFSGGAFSQASIFALGIMPYITASIVIQLLGMVLPQFQKLQREGESGHMKINQYTRYLTVLILLLQAPAYLFNLEYQVNSAAHGTMALTWLDKTYMTVILAAGSMFIMWLGERITDKGVGNGISFIILIGIIARLPGAFIEEFMGRISSAQGGLVMLVIEIVLLFAVGFIPQEYNMLATMLVSFTCAMQVQTFRKVGGYSYASTMCIGNLRSGTAALSMYLRDKKKEQLRQAGYYFGVILAFAIGAGIGGVFSMLYGIHVIWISCGLLLVSFLLMSLEKYR